jgi:hypothetical protein
MLFYEFTFMSGLPYFSLPNIPKQGKIYQTATKLPKGHKLYQMAVIYIPNDYRIYQLFSFQGPPKFTKVGFFGLNIYVPSGNPDLCASSLKRSLFPNCASETKKARPFQR